MSNNTITIKLDAKNNINQTTQRFDEEGSEISKEETFKKAKGLSNSAIKTGAIMLGQKAGQFVINNYGSLTGDYKTQDKINNSLEIVSLGAMAITGGPVGLAAAVGSIAMKGLTYQIEMTKKKQQTDFLRARIGGYNE